MLYIQAQLTVRPRRKSMAQGIRQESHGLGEVMCSTMKLKYKVSRYLGTEELSRWVYSERAKSLSRAKSVKWQMPLFFWVFHEMKDKGIAAR
jgi:hypothetical protein